MSDGTILYLDEANEPLERLLRERSPKGFELYIGAGERDQALALADYLMVAASEVDENLIAGASKTRLIQKTGVGIDNIDLRAARRREIPVANTPGANSTAVAEHTILLILALYRKLLKLDAETKRGNWPMWDLRPYSFEMRGKVHGIIGFGSVGREVARLSHAFGTSVLYFDEFRSPEAEHETGAVYAPLEQVLQQADILSLHVPLVPGTRNLIGAEEFAIMKSEAILINVARGGIVDEHALTAALREASIAGAGVDVWEQEPVVPDHPLLSLQNVIATPHAGAGTRDTLIRVLDIAFTNIARVARGKSPLHVVNEATTNINGEGGLSGR
jgi:D-3-phosphoglycerate dehydrogenase